MALKNVIDTELAAHRLTEWLGRKVDGAQDFLVTDLCQRRIRTDPFSTDWN